MTVNDLTDETTWDDDYGHTWTVNGDDVTLTLWEELAGYIRVTRIL